MCGGINLSQSVGAADGKKASLRGPILYNLGRVISYTVIGGVVGGVGSVLFLSETVKAVILVVAALGMLLMGLGMLGWLPWWLIPRTPAFLTKGLGKAGSGKGPLVVGLLNGFIPCGPLQAMQLYALATGSVLTGALSMLLFSLGTVPLMLGAGAIFSALKGKFTYVIQRVSAVLVVFFAVVMAASAFNLLGGRTVATEAPQAASATAKPEEKSSVAFTAGARQRLSACDGGRRRAKGAGGPEPVGLSVYHRAEGNPRRVYDHGGRKEYHRLQPDRRASAYNVKKALNAGDNVIKFTPEETGLVPYTCWMGMLDGRILVVDDLGGAAK